MNTSTSQSPTKVHTENSQVDTKRSMVVMEICVIIWNNTERRQCQNKPRTILLYVGLKDHKPRKMAFLITLDFKAWLNFAKELVNKYRQFCGFMRRSYNFSIIEASNTYNGKTDISAEDHTIAMKYGGDLFTLRGWINENMLLNLCGLKGEWK